MANEHEFTDGGGVSWAEGLSSCESVKLWRVTEDEEWIELHLSGGWRRYRYQELLTPDSLHAMQGWLAGGSVTPLRIQLQPGPWGWRAALLERVLAAGPLAGILTSRPAPPQSEPECHAGISEGPALAVLDDGLRLLRFSPRWAQMHQLDPARLSGASLYELFPGTRETHAAHLERCLAGEPAPSIPTQLTLADGATLFTRWDVWPWRDQKGDIGGLLLLAAPAACRLHEHWLARSQQMLELAVDILDQRVFWRDRNGRYLGCNQAFARDAGLSDPSKILGLTDHDLPWSNFAAEYLAHDRAVMDSRSPHRNYEQTLLTAAGEIYARMSKIPLLDKEGQVRGCLGLFQDISEERRRRDDLRHARDAAEKANRIKSEFLASISHELRTPMHGILGMADLVLDSTLTHDQQDCVEAIHSSAKVLLHIINDILDLSKIEAGKLQLSPGPLDLAAFLKTNLRLLESTARGKGLELNVVIEDGTPPYWRGDQVRLAQILTNLVGNAVKFTHEGGSVTIRVSAGGSDERRRLLVLEVADTGIGISQSKLGVIFDAFTQADGATTKQFGGTGLGLTITRQLVELMGGRVSVESDLGKGSTFRCSCRLEALSEEEFLAARAPEQPKTAHAAVPASTPPLEILLVEDNRINQRIAQRLLEKEGALVTIANDGWEALELLDREGLHERFDLVLMDCLMPVMNGWDAARAIRQREEGGERHLTVMALTASVMESDREMCRQAGMDDVLAKPIDQTHLHQTLENVRRARDLARLSYNLQ